MVTVGTVIDGPWERNREIRGLFQKEITDLLRGEFDVRFPEEKRQIGNWTPLSVTNALGRLLADPEVDIVLVLGVLGTNCGCIITDLPKPVLAPFVLDMDLQGLPSREGASGVPNLSYTAFPSTIRRDLETFRQIAPFLKLAILTNLHYQMAMPALGRNLVRIADEMDMEIVNIPVGDSADQTLRDLPADVEAVYLAPLLHLPTPEFDRLLQGFIDRRLPSFSLFGRMDVERGVFAGLMPEDTFLRLARRVALNVQRILLGEDAGTIPIAFQAQARLSINMATARAIGVWPPFHLLGEAELLNEEAVEVERRLTLEKAVQEALAANLDLAAKERAVAAGQASVRSARAALLPQVELSSLGRIIDDDRAAASFGSESERKLTGTASLTQLLFSEPAWARYTARKHLQESRVQEREGIFLDVALDAAVAYFNVLRARTFERIQKENLGLTRSNLELAQIRQSIGISGPAEVYRWESQLASSRQAVLRAAVLHKQARQALNRLLHRPLDEPFVTEEVGLDDPLLTTSDPRLARHIRDPYHFGLFRRFLVAEGLAHSVEIRGLDAAVAAQERKLASAKRAWWAPTAVLSAEVTESLAEDGTGTQGPALPAPLAGILPEVDDTSWTVGVKVSLPLLEGGGRSAEEREALESLEQLRLERAAVRERIEQRIQAEAIDTEASFPGIELSRDAAEAARKNLDLVTDSYSRGVVSILDLIDAQNAALVADQVAANAVYDFLVDLMEIQRAMNGFDFFLATGERDAWFERLAVFVDAAEGKR